VTAANQRQWLATVDTSVKIAQEMTVCGMWGVSHISSGILHWQKAFFHFFFNMPDRTVGSPDYQGEGGGEELAFTGQNFSS